MVSLTGTWRPDVTDSRRPEISLFLPSNLPDSRSPHSPHTHTHTPTHPETSLRQRCLPVPFPPRPCTPSICLLGVFVSRHDCYLPRPLLFGVRSLHFETRRCGSRGRTGPVSRSGMKTSIALRLLPHPTRSPPLTETMHRGEPFGPRRRSPVLTPSRNVDLTPRGSPK